MMLNSHAFITCNLILLLALPLEDYRLSNHNLRRKQPPGFRKMPPTSILGVKGLGVEIDLNLNRINIRFRTEAQAIAYCQVLETRVPDKAATREDGSFVVSIRLPSRVTSIVASTQYGGYYLVFSDPKLADWWNKKLIVWKLIEGSSRKLYVDRYISDESLNHSLGIRARNPEYGANEPALARVSEKTKF
ncbi:hypothetical protein EDB80DRAFT_711413 [Ilyonectria destructans]|nr:hypothetical protein EDB80DRAFT_711413 [Ilyonectria destructans]